MNATFESSFDYRRAPQVEYSFPPGVKIVDFIFDDMREKVNPHWNAFPPINPMWHYLFGTIFIFLACCSFAGNGLVLYLFSKTKDLKTPTNNLVVNLAFVDLVMMLTRCPPFIYNAFNGGRWHFGPFMCELSAFSGGVLGMCNIYTMTAIAYDRYNVIVRGMNAPRLTNGKSIAIIFVCWSCAIVWHLPPFFGWSKFELEGTLYHCSIDYFSRDSNTIIYATGLFIAAYCTPLSIIVFCYFFIVRTIFEHEKTLREQAAKMNVASLRSNASANEQSAEMRIAKIALMNVTLWVAMWTPYACLVMQGIYGDQSTITPLSTVIPALGTKLSSIWNPIVFAMSHPKYRLALQKTIPWFCINEKEAAPSNTSTTTGATIESNSNNA